MNDSGTRVPSATTAPSHAERLFPRLTEALIQRIAALGMRRQTTKDETLDVVKKANFTSTGQPATRAYIRGGQTGVATFNQDLEFVTAV